MCCRVFLSKPVVFCTLLLLPMLLGQSSQLHRCSTMHLVHRRPCGGPIQLLVLLVLLPGCQHLCERRRQLLGDRLSRAEAGQGQIVSLVGEPGIGKSRLVEELHREAGHRVTWLEGQAVSFGRAIPFHPLIDLIRRACRVDEGDPETAIVPKLETVICFEFRISFVTSA